MHHMRCVSVHERITVADAGAMRAAVMRVRSWGACTFDACPCKIMPRARCVHDYMVRGCVMRAARVVRARAIRASSVMRARVMRVRMMRARGSVVLLHVIRTRA
eukprot:6205152-Pleurochrysis_carterae.AAC.3